MTLLIFLSFFVVSGSLSSTGTNWHMSLLPRQEKKHDFSSKQKGNKLKFGTTNRGPAYPVFREAGGRGREGEDGGRGKGGKVEVCGGGGG